MIKILYFASVREALGRAEEKMLLSHEITDVGALRQYLMARGDPWKNILANRVLRVAVNQEIVSDNTKLKAHDEVAFFPPVTGG